MSLVDGEAKAWREPTTKRIRNGRQGKNVVVLTYDHPHRKTEDVLWRLMAAGKWGELKVVATPWVERKQRNYIYGHRPAEKHWPCAPMSTPYELCAKLGVSFRRAEKGNLAGVLADYDIGAVVVGGAGILPKEVVTNHTVLNVHPGLLPARRGLDVFKWAILDCVPVGVTAHICDEHTDLGWRLVEREVPVYREDSLQSFAMRQYEYELGMIPEALEMVLCNIASTKNDRFDKIHPGETRAFKRMPRKTEAQLPSAFERYKWVHAS